MGASLTAYANAAPNVTLNAIRTPGPNNTMKNNRFIGEPGGIRTRDPLIKSQMLYRLSYGLARAGVTLLRRLAQPGPLDRRGGRQRSKQPTPWSPKDS